MRRRSLLAQLLGWQLWVTGTACVLLVIGTLVAGAVIIRHDQDDVLSKLSETMCSGIEAERIEYSDQGMHVAAERFFEESSIQGHRLEYRHRREGLLVARGPFAGASVDSVDIAADPSCTSYDDVDERQRTVPLRMCVARCDDEHVVRVATHDALSKDEVRLAAFVLIGFLPVALIVGGVAGRFVLGRLLAPLRQLRDAAGAVEAGPRMSLGVGAEPEELGQLEDAFDTLLKRVGDLVDREKRFSQEASHELRTPLTNIRLRMETLRGRTDAPAALEHIDAALRDLDSLDELLEALLLLARSESAELPCAPVNLCDLAREAAASLTARRPSDASAVDVDAPDEILVSGNEELLARAVGNVVENAHAYAGSRAEIRIRVHTENGSGVISVDDDGPGIAAADRRVAFERFFRGASHRTRTSGTGLGLAVVSTIARRHSGDVRASASRLGGEQIQIRIPVI